MKRSQPTAKTHWTGVHGISTAASASGASFHSAFARSPMTPPIPQIHAKWRIAGN